MAVFEKGKNSFVDSRLDIKVLLSGLWVVLMILYLYCDVLSLYKPGAIRMMMDGLMGPFKVSQMSLLSASLLMIIPACMVFLSLSLKASMNRRLNIAAGSVYTLVGIGNIMDESMVYYVVFVILEWAVTLAIIGLSVKWPRRHAEIPKQG